MNGLIITLLIIAIGVGWYYYNQHRQKLLEARKAEESKASHLALAKKIHDLLFPVNSALEDGTAVPLDQVEKLAQNPQSRFFLYEALRSFGKTNLFPQKYLSHEASAESQLVHYLSHVHALGTTPEELTLVEKQSVSDAGHSHDYYVFKFKANPSHVTSKNGWMQGVVGPFAQNSPPYSRALATHSYLKSLESTSSQEHVQYAHSQKNPKLSDLEKKILHLA